jgi:hypothetical protein
MSCASRVLSEALFRPIYIKMINTQHDIVDYKRNYYIVKYNFTFYIRKKMT